MTTVTELLDQTQVELAEAKARIATLEAALAQCKQTQLELQSTAERYRLLSNSIPDALFVLGLDEANTPMQLLEVNESACRLLGYSRDELIQLTLDDIDDPVSTTPKPYLFERLRAGEAISFEQTHITRQGYHIPVEVHAQMGVVQGKSVVISLAHDISRRQRIEQELRLFEAVVRQTDDAVVIADATIEQAPPILFVNDAFTRITGYTLQGMSAQRINFFQLAGVGTDDPQELRTLHDTLLQGEVYRGKTRSSHKNGALLVLQWSITPLVDQKGAITHFVAMIRDCTTQEQQLEQLQITQNALQSYQNNLTSILDTMQDALVSLSLPEQQLIYASTSFERIFGYPLRAFLDDPLFFTHIVHPDDLESALAAAQKIFSDGALELEHRIILPDGQVRWLHRRAWLTYDEQGQPMRLHDSAHDITTRKQTEEALRQNETYLRSLMDSQTAFNIRVDMAGNISYCNKRYQQQFNWFHPSIVGLPALSMILPVDHEKVYQVVTQCMAQVGVPLLVELRKPRSDGGCMWTFWEFIAVADPAGVVHEVQCVGFDMTQQKEAEASLRNSEKRYRQMFELHGLPKLIIDPANGRILDANPAAGQFYGYAIDTLKTLTIFDVNLSPLADVQAKMAKAANSAMLSCEFIHRSASGEPRHVEVFTGPLESDGKPLLYSVITDVTEKERAKAALQEAHDLLEIRVIERTAELEKVKNRLEAIFEHSGDSILLLDVHQGIQQANHAFDLLFPLSDGNHVGRTLTDYFRSMQEIDLAATLAEVAATHQTRQIEAQTITLYEAPRDVEISIAPVNRSEQAVTSLVCIIRDITERKQAELTIAEERNLLRTVIDTVPDYIYVKDTNHRMLLNNVAHAHSLGVDTPLAVIGKTDLELLPATMAAKFIADEKQILQTGRPILRTEERSTAQDGSEIWAMTTKVPLRNLKGDLVGIVGITHDISQLKITEDALRYHEKQSRDAQKMLQLVLDTIPVAVFWKDRLSRYLGCNRLFAEHAGLDHTTTIIGAQDEELPWAVTGAPAYRTDDLAVMENGLPKLGYEETLLTAAGKQLVIQTNKLPLRDEANQVIGILGTYVDITARKEAESAVRESEARYRLLAENVKDVIIKYSGESICTYVTPSSLHLLGYTPAELMGCRLLDLIHPEDHARTMQMGKDAFTGGNLDSFTIMHRVRHKDERYIWVEATNTIVRDPLSGLALEGIAVFRDITERKRAEDALQQALSQEKELGELKSRFVSMASHEFRTPLAAILTTTETLTYYRAKMTPEQIEGRLSKIRQQVIYMKEIMEDVLQLARMQSGRVDFLPSQGDFAALCQEIIEEFASQPAYQDRIVYGCSTASIPLAFDQRLIRQVISNLILNALKYSPAEKRVTVDLIDEPAQVLFRVCDQGIGIPAADLKRLFEPFHRATNVSTISGTGLGLSIAKQAIDLHGGSIIPVSEVGVGTTFTVTLPKRL